MRKLLLIFFLLSTSQISQGQNHRYQVEINNHRAGSFRQSTEIDQSIHTFSTLDFQILTPSDTLQYYSHSHFTESFSGLLQSVSWTQVLTDTLNYEVYFKNDTITYYDFLDSSKVFKSSNTVVCGPKKIRTLSKQQLDTIGSKVFYQTFSIELNQAVKIKRELIGHRIEKAQKLNMVRETMSNGSSTIREFDKDYHLIRTTSSSPFGEIKLTRADRTIPSQFFESEFFEQNRLLSNIRFPDPHQISSVKLKIEGLDSAYFPNLNFSNQKITAQDSSSFILILTAKEEEYSNSSFQRFINTEIRWSHSKSLAILDSLGLDSLDHRRKSEKIRAFSKSQKTHQNITLYQLALAAQIPARLVYGYAYSQWFWKPKIWTELAIDGVWIPMDLTTEIESNTALKIASYKSEIGAILSHAYLDNIPKIKDIQVLSFTLNEKKQAVSSQSLPYYFEIPVYENEGLGIRFNLPDGFSISNEGINTPSSLFLSLENSYQEKISFYQFLSKKEELTDQSIERLIRKNLQDESITVNKNKKTNLYHAFKEQKGVILIPQGLSYILITIAHEDPDFITLLLTRKNLHFKY